MKIMEYTYNDRIYKFVLTMSAQAEINGLQFKQFENMKNPEIFSLLAEQESITHDVDYYTELKEKAEEEKNAEALKEYDDKLSEAMRKRTNIMAKVIPSIKDYTSLMRDQVDPVEVAIIMLKNYRDYKDTMTDELASAIMEDMEYQLGFEEFNIRMDELIDKVFTTIGLVQSNREKVMKKINKIENKMDKSVMS